MLLRLRQMMIIDPKNFRIILDLIAGHRWKPALISSTHGNQVGDFIVYTPIKSGKIFSSHHPLSQIGADIFIPSLPEQNQEKDFNPLTPSKSGEGFS